MAFRIKHHELEVDFGAGHWKLVPGPDGELRVEPFGYYAASWFALIGMGSMIAAALLWPELKLEFGDRVIIAYFGGAITIGISSFFYYIYRHEERLGPFLVLRPDELRFRHDRRLAREEFDSFVIQRQWEDLADGTTKVSRLFAKSKSGEQIQIIASAYHRQVVKLKDSLDKHLARTPSLE